MKSKNKVNNSNQSKLIIESFELQDEKIVIQALDSVSNEDEIKTFSLVELENWLKENQYLKGQGEDFAGADHEGNAFFIPSKWDFTVEDILNGTSDWSASELLQDFINQQIQK